MAHPLMRSSSPVTTLRLSESALRRLRHDPVAAPGHEEEPWWMETAGDSDRDGWMLSYLDILTLLLTLLVVIVAVTHAELQKRTVLPPVPLTPLAAASPAQTIASPTSLALDKSATILPSQSATTALPPLAPVTSRQPTAAMETTAQPAMSAATPPEAVVSLLPATVAQPAAIPAPVQPASAPFAETRADVTAVNRDAPALSPEPESLKADAPSTGIAEPPSPTPARVMTTAKASPDRTIDDKHSLATLGDTGWMQVQVGERGVMIALGEDVLFTSASASLASQSVPALDALASILAEMPYTVWVEGHTDNSPIATAAFPSNWELSTARATAVTRYLVERGLAPHRLRAVGYGDTQPRSSNDTAAGRSQNRRVVFRVEMPPPGTP